MTKKALLSMGILFGLCFILTGCNFSKNNVNDNQNLNQNEQELVETNNIETNDVEVSNIDENIVEKIDEIGTETGDVENIEKNEDTFTFESKTDKYSIEIPSSWTFKENEYNFSVLLYTPEDDDIKENLGVSVQKPQIETNLQEYYSASMERISGNAEGFNEISSDDITIDGLTGKSTIYEMNEGDIKVKSQQTILIKNNVVYILQYTATQETFDKYINSVNNIIKSFKVL